MKKANMKKAYIKKAYMAAAALLAALQLSACSGNGFQASEAEEGDGQTEVEITLWTFPVGNWGNPTMVSSLLSGFHKQYPGIHVSVEYLTYDNGDARIEQAAADGTLPDLVLEGPERLVAAWGDEGLMADLSDLWDADASDGITSQGTTSDGIASQGIVSLGIYENVRDACQHSSGAYYAFPICMTAHCMAINYDMFREAGALAYIDEETHTWTPEGFVSAVGALREYGLETAGVIYCKNQSGDQGTRALVNNLCGGSFTDKAHTVYTVDSEENIRALQLLYGLDGITFDPSASAVDAIEQFCRKETAMTFCWNVSLEIQHTINNPNLDFEVFPMAFPADEGSLELSGGIWGLGIFDSGDDERVEAAKCFIRYMTGDREVYRRAVLTSTYWPVCDMPNIYVNDMLMTEYGIFMPYMGDYYQETPGWPQARAAWWQTLQRVGAGMDVSEAVKNFPAADYTADRQDLQ